MAAPEQRMLILQIKQEYQSVFVLANDSAEFVMDTLSFGLIRTTNRTINNIWLMSWVMWKEMYCWSSFLVLINNGEALFVKSKFDELPGQKESYDEADGLLAKTKEFISQEQLNWKLWPTSVPKIQDIPSSGDENKLANDLAHHAIAFFYLHELRHLILGKQNESFKNPIDEEFECDRWAAHFLTEKAEDYANQEGHDNPLLVRSKRAMGIALGATVIAHVQKSQFWEPSGSHPAIADRFKRLTEILNIASNDYFWVVANSFLLGCLRRENAVPTRVAFENQQDLFNKLLQHGRLG